MKRRVEVREESRNDAMRDLDDAKAFELIN